MADYLMKVAEVAEILGTHPMKVPDMILNGTMPVGAVFEGTERRTIVIRARFEAWFNAEDLKGYRNATK